MKYDRTAPCDNCPFRRGHIKLSAARVREISRAVLGNPGRTFPCHKTTTAGGAKDDRNQQHCAGALLYAEKQGMATQMTRICERLGLYDPRALLAAGHAGEVFDSEKDMARAHRTAVPL